jgi:hypothetical protein
MNNRLLDENKGCTPNGDINHKTVLAIKLTECLTRHDQCSGFYEDSLTGKYILYCSCICHICSSKSNVLSLPDTVVEDTPAGADSLRR